MVMILASIPEYSSGYKTLKSNSCFQCTTKKNSYCFQLQTSKCCLPTDLDSICLSSNCLAPPNFSQDYLDYLKSQSATSNPIQESGILQAVQNINKFDFAKYQALFLCRNVFPSPCNQSVVYIPPPTYDSTKRSKFSIDAQNDEYCYFQTEIFEIDNTKSKLGSNDGEVNNPAKLEDVYLVVEFKQKLKSSSTSNQPKMNDTINFQIFAYQQEDKSDNQVGYEIELYWQQKQSFNNDGNHIDIIVIVVISIGVILGISAISLFIFFGIKEYKKRKLQNQTVQGQVQLSQQDDNSIQDDFFSKSQIESQRKNSIKALKRAITVIQNKTSTPNIIEDYEGNHGFQESDNSSDGPAKIFYRAKTSKIRISPRKTERESFGNTTRYYLDNTTTNMNHMTQTNLNIQDQKQVQRKGSEQFQPQNSFRQIQNKSKRESFQNVERPELQPFDLENLSNYLMQDVMKQKKRRESQKHSRPRVLSTGSFASQQSLTKINRKMQNSNQGLATGLQIALQELIGTPDIDRQSIESQEDGRNIIEHSDQYKSRDEEKFNKTDAFQADTLSHINFDTIANSHSIISQMHDNTQPISPSKRKDLFIRVNTDEEIREEQEDLEEEVITRKHKDSKLQDQQYEESNSKSQNSSMVQMLYDDKSQQSKQEVILQYQSEKQQSRPQSAQNSTTLQQQFQKEEISKASQIQLTKQSDLMLNSQSSNENVLNIQEQNRIKKSVQRKVFIPSINEINENLNNFQNQAQNQSQEEYKDQSNQKGDYIPNVAKSMFYKKNTSLQQEYTINQIQYKDEL
eukprot:403375239